MSISAAAVPEEVGAAFGLDGAPEVLSGGLAPAFRFGVVVVKAIDDEIEATYIADVMHRVVVDERLVRVGRPVASGDGTWVVEGWTAWRWLPGRVQLAECQPWEDALRAIDALHIGLADFPRSPGLDRRSHPWARADRFAWQEAAAPLRRREIAELVERHLPAYQPIDLESQLVHGDTCANLLFDPVLPPAVIDFSPYWRPAGWAKAVYIIDALSRSCEASLLNLAGDEPAMGQLLRRAAVFRLVSLDGWAELGTDIGERLRRHAAISELFDAADVR